MKVAFINIYQGAVERGAETYVNELSRRLGENISVKVYGLAKKPLSRWPILWRTYLDPFGLQTFWCTLKLTPSLFRERYDFVIPVNGGWQPALVRLITWVYGGKMIISGQSGMGWDERNNLWCFPDRFVALTEHAKRWANRVNRFVRVEVIPNGVDVKRYSDERSKIQFGLERPIILSVGALVSSKRHDLAIYAVSKLKKGSLLLVGKGGAGKELQELGNKHLAGRFKIASYPHGEMAKVYRSADLLTFPTNPNESFGIVILEAMASELPVVVSEDPIRREIAGESGIYVDPENTEKYAEALENGLSHKNDHKYQLWAKKFDWDKIALKYEILLNSIINKNNQKQLTK